MNKHQVEIDTTKCIGCGLCAKICVAHNIELQGEKVEIVLEANCQSNFYQDLEFTLSNKFILFLL